MEPDFLPTELILSDRHQLLGQAYLGWTPQPGSHVDFQGKTYQVLERRHRYQLKANRYRLHKVALHVQAVQLPDEVSRVNEKWVIGDVTCRFNAHSELIRCAVNPKGPCQGCKDYESFS